MHRRSLLGLGASASLAVACRPPAGRPPAAGHTEIEEASIAELSARMASGELSARALTTAYLARIDAIDRAGPTLRAVLEPNPDALAIATALDDERKAKGARSPLHGIPILVKDNIDTGDRMQTTAGSLALMGSPARTDATVVAKLRAAGAVILGKTNLSEWANIRDDDSTSGWSARGGFTRNPYALDRNPSGSSSGSAAAVSASLAAAAIGTETNGSILSPAAMGSLVGLKPTVGLVSRAGIIPISETQDTAGPMARSVRDAALVLAAIAGADAADPATSAARVANYTERLTPDGARGKRLGVLRPPWLGPATRPTYEATLAALTRLGATLVDVRAPAPTWRDAQTDMLLYELKAGLAKYLANRGHATLRTLDDIVRFNVAHAKEELAVFGQSHFEKARALGGLDAPEYVKARDTCRRASREEGLDAILAGEKLDAVVVPTSGPAWLTDLVNGDSFTGAGYGLAAMAGYPSITVPSGAIRGLPLGICFMGPPWSEPTLLGLAYAVEQEIKQRRKPTFAATITALRAEHGWV